MDLDTYFLIVTYVLSGVFGLCVGSFLNVVIYRVPIGMRLDKPDSHCPKCNYKLRWYDNIPVFSYIILGGKCRKCKQKISFRYTAVEIANMLLWLLSVHLFWDAKDASAIVFTVMAALCSSLLICVFFIDLEHMLVFDRFVIILAALGVVSTVFDKQYPWYSHLIGAAAGFLFFYGVYAFFYYVRKKEAIGGGDIKLALAMGLLLGWERLVLSLFIAFVFGALVLVTLARLRRDEEGGEYPFAPFLCVGFATALFFGKTIIDAYLSLIV